MTQLTAIASLGPLAGAAAVIGIAMNAFGLWPALALLVLGWAATAYAFARATRAGGAPIRMPAGLRLVERDFADGEIVIREGDPATCLYVIVSGKVQVWRNDEYGGRIDVAELVPGQIFGEMGLLNGGTRTASVEAVGRARMFEVPREMFETIISQSGSVATMVREIAARRQAAH